MHIARPHRQYRDEIDAFARSVQLAALTLVAWFLETGVAERLGLRAVRIWFAAELRCLRADIRELILQRVALDLSIPLDWKPPLRRPRGAPPGFRRVRRHPRILRVLAGGVRLTSLADMQAALDALPRLVRRGLARLKRARATGTLRAVAPAAQPCAPLQRVAPRVRDTS